MGPCNSRLVLTGIACLAMMLSVSCGGSAVGFQAVLSEEVAGAIIPLDNQGVLVIANDSEQLAVTCVFIRDSSTDPNASWGTNRVPANNPIGPGEQRDFSLIQGLYDIAVIRPSLDPDAINGDETFIIAQFFVSENTVHDISVNDFTDFADIAPHCTTSN